MASKVETELGIGDCQATAFFLGAMYHYIADAVFFPHLSAYSESEGVVKFSLSLGATLKTRVHYLTSKKLSDWAYINGKISANEPLFTHKDAAAEFAVYKPKYMAASLVTKWAGIMYISVYL